MEKQSTRVSCLEQGETLIKCTKAVQGLATLISIRD